MNKKAYILLLLTFIYSISSFFSIILENIYIKYFSVCLLIASLVVSVRIILKYHKNINLKRCLLIISLISCYPLLRIVLAILLNMSFKNFTDGIFIYGAYYELLIICLAFSLIIDYNKFDVLLLKFSSLSFPLGLVLLYYSFKLEKEFGIRCVNLSIVNCFVPCSLLVFFPFKLRSRIIGWISILMILYSSAIIGSRSYFLIGCYFIIFSVVQLIKAKQYRLILSIIFIGITLYLMGLSSILNQSTELSEKSIVEKFQIESLFRSSYFFLNNGDVNLLFFWEGNSRSNILIDAFRHFTTFNWMFGKGIFSKYSSFIDRSTIEVGWAQEIFRWGITYVALVIGLTIKGYMNLKRRRKTEDIDLFNMLCSIIIIRILDGFVYGVPELSIYNLIFFLAIIFQGIKNNNSKILNKQDVKYI